MKKFKRAADIKVGVIGYGEAFKMGRQHIHEMKAAGMTPVAVADTDKSRLAVAEQDYPGIETYTSVATMLRKSQVHLITIITPHNTHAKLVLQCLRAGRSVCCEKPLAITTAECDTMIREAKKHRLVLTTYHNRHWDGCILRAVKEIRRGIIGDVVRIEAHMGGYGRPGNWWRSSKSISGGILYDWGVHLLEYGLQIIRGDIAEVTAYSKNGFWARKTAWKADTNEDEAFAVVRFADGKWMSMCVSSIDSHPKEGQLEITGTKGTYIFGGEDWQTITHKNGRAVSKRGQNPPGQGHRFYKNVADHMVKGTKLIITPEWSRRPIHILDLADQSARKGKAIRAKHK